MSLVNYIDAAQQYFDDLVIKATDDELFAGGYLAHLDNTNTHNLQALCVYYQPLTNVLFHAERWRKSRVQIQFD